MPFQLLLYNMVPTLLETFQLPEAWIGEELGQEGESAAGWRPVVPLPCNPGKSGLQFLTLRSGNTSKIWMDQWFQACNKPRTQLSMVFTKVLSCQNRRDALSSRPTEGQEGLRSGPKGQEGSIDLVSESKAADDTASE